MLLLGSSFENMPVLSLRTGTAVGKVIGHLINPHKLCIDAMWCRMNGIRDAQLVMVRDIREVSIKGVIVDDHEVAIDQSDAIRLQSIIDLAYDLVGKKVISGRLPIGKVSDYAVEINSFTIQKLYASPGVLAKLKTTKLTIDRAQIIEVSQKYVKVSDSRVPARTLRKAVPRNQPSLSPSASASTTSE